MFIKKGIFFLVAFLFVGSLFSKAETQGGVKGTTQGWVAQADNNVDFNAKPVAAPKAFWIVVYCDNSENIFRFWQQIKGGVLNFQYSPKLPESSSSGIYNGGEPNKGLVNRGLSQDLWRWVRRLEADASLNVKSKMMGPGAFIVKEKTGTREFMIKDSPPLREFNEFIAQFRGPTPNPRFP